MMTDSIKADVLFKSKIEEYNAEFDALYNK